MKEIVHLQLGKAGNGAGYKFWETICGEHKIGADGIRKERRKNVSDKTNVFFQQSKKNKYFPRAVLADLDYSTIENIQCSPYGNIFRHENLIHGRTNAGRNWAKGYYSEGSRLANTILNRIRLEAERCDCLQGIQVLHSIAGGTGSGLGSLILQNLRDEYRDRALRTYTLFPSQNVEKDRAETYTSVIGLRHLNDIDMETHCYDNKALEVLCEEVLSVPKASFRTMNELISTSMAAVTTTIRLPGTLNEKIIKSSINLVPFPKLHYLTVGYLPITKDFESDQMLSVAQLSNGLLNPKNMFIKCEGSGKFMTANLFYRGKISANDVKNYTHYLFRKLSKKFVNWIPNNVQVEVCPTPPLCTEQGAAILGNYTGVKAVFFRILQMFDALHNSKKYIHLFTGEGMEKDEIEAARESVLDLIEKYEKCETADRNDVWDMNGNEVLLFS